MESYKQPQPNSLANRRESLQRELMESISKALDAAARVNRELKPDDAFAKELWPGYSELQRMILPFVLGPSGRACDKCGGSGRA